MQCTHRTQCDIAFQFSRLNPPPNCREKQGKIDLDCVAKNIVEGRIFIYDDSTNFNLTRINGNDVHLCSHIENIHG
jgi:hypothetical protein